MAGWASDLTLAATVVGLAVAVAGIWGAARVRWKRTLGSRRDLARRLNSLAAGVSSEYLAVLLGVPALGREDADGLIAHVYATRHAWVEVLLERQSNTVSAFAITVTDRRFRFDTATLTFGQLRAQLGKSSFAEITSTKGWGSEPNSVRWILGARSCLYAEHYYRGNPGGYQDYVLAWNDVGVGTCGMFTALPGQVPPSYEDGRFAGDVASPSARPDWAAARRVTTINTLQVLGPGVPGAQQPFPRPGVHQDVIRLLRGKGATGM